jgi:uncharacterized protein (DUF2384 family)
MGGQKQSVGGIIPSAGQGAFPFSPTMAIWALEQCHVVVHSTNDNMKKLQRLCSPSWRRRPTPPGRVWIFEIFETPSADQGALSFSSTRAIWALECCNVVVDSTNDNVAKLQRLYLPSWRRRPMTDAPWSCLDFSKRRPGHVFSR